MNLDQRLAVAEFFKKRFEKTRRDGLNPEAAEDMVVGERHAAKFAGGVAAWVSMPQPATRVTSQEKLLAWCREYLPDAIEKVDRVRPDTAKALCEQVKKYGGWIGPDGDLDNVTPVAGIETGDPSPRVELEDDAETLIAAAWRAGDIDLAGMLAIGAAPDAPAPEVITEEEALRGVVEFLSDEHGFKNPAFAAAHAIHVQGGYSTPPREAYRMLRDGGVAAERARTWLLGVGLDPDDPDGENAPWPLPEAGDAKTGAGS